MLEICHPYVELITKHSLLIQLKRKSSFCSSSIATWRWPEKHLVCLTTWNEVGKMKTNGATAYCWLAKVFCIRWEIQDIHPNREWTEHFSNCDCAGQQSIPHGVKGWGQQDRMATYYLTYGLSSTNSVYATHGMWWTLREISKSGAQHAKQVGQESRELVRA